jgi:hypothetical protein
VVKRNHEATSARHEEAMPSYYNPHKKAADPNAAAATNKKRAKNDNTTPTSFDDLVVFFAKVLEAVHCEGGEREREREKRVFCFEGQGRSYITSPFICFSRRAFSMAQMWD